MLTIVNYILLYYFLLGSISPSDFVYVVFPIVYECPWNNDDLFLTQKNSICFRFFRIINAGEKTHCTKKPKQSFCLITILHWYNGLNENQTYAKWTLKWSYKTAQYFRYELSLFGDFHVNWEFFNLMETSPLSEKGC